MKKFVKKNNPNIDVSIGINFFAPKCIDRDLNFDIRNSHAIANTKCNFNCSFCKYAKDNKRQPNYMSLETYKQIIVNIMKKGRMFKFTGGEPCMNPYLEEEIKIVKENGGTVFLDTNGSIFKTVKKLLDQDLIDVLGISLKGLTAEEALRTSGMKSQRVCWDNVIDTIKEGSKHSNTRVIVTYVAYNEFNYENLLEFSKILSSLGDNIFLKINNLNLDTSLSKELKPLDNLKLEELIKQFVDENPIWKNRVILINGKEAISDYSKILFF